jgi:hypothetical protein
MAGRNISVTHQALGTIRVMRTCGMMGEIVGKAAYLAVLHQTSPRGVYEKHLPELIQLAGQPGATRRDSLNGESRLDPSIPDLKSLPVGSMNRDLPQFANLLSQADGSTQVLKGIVVDDSNAKLTGKWEKTGLVPNIGGGARYATRGQIATARFEFIVPTSGKYEIRVFWAGHENRASNTPCNIEVPGRAPMLVKLNQTETPEKGAQSIGVFELQAGATNAVVLSTAGANGNVVADAVQIVPAP